jgi:hypothetical protein
MLLSTLQAGKPQNSLEPEWKRAVALCDTKDNWHPEIQDYKFTYVVNWLVDNSAWLSDWCRVVSP